ncbi:MAG: fused MFS/spermidine synthase, partial [Proteobacteria bacterium]|nr:fused MFS/spermidine synthase [Pseudomonadota bacterium]
MKPRRGFGWLLACFFLSGWAGLAYQIAWTRQFAFVFGTSELAVATVLSSYMGGLAAGAALAARFAHRIRRPVLAYGLLELGIAGSAIVAVPLGIQLCRALYVAWFGGDAGPSDAGGVATGLFYAACTFAIVMIPTSLMGATLPLLARHAVTHEREIGSRIGGLYAVNTVGAVFGAVSTGFLVIPAAGLRGSIALAAAVNALVFVAAVLLARAAGPSTPGSPQLRPSLAGGRFILPAMLVSGLLSFVYEVLWTRLLGHVLGGSLYAFSTMLGTFLAGIALGSALASRFATTPERAARGFALVQLGTGLLSFAAFAALDRIPGLARAGASLAWPPFALDALASAAVLLPPALCIGATFPFAVRMVAGRVEDAGPASARVYAWNTVGSILGAVGAGFLVLPALGYAGTLAVGVLGNLMLASAAALWMQRGRALVWCTVAAAAGGLVLLPAQTPWRVLRSSPLDRSPATGRLVYDAVGRSATVLLLEDTGGWQLRTNGLPESVILPAGGRPTRYPLARWLGSLHTVLRPDSPSLLAVGLGGGALLESVPPGVERIDVVELEPEVIEANRRVADRRHRDPLSDPRVRLVANDARGALLVARGSYSAIVSQPSHPWTAGSSHLYTREFFSLARERLDPGGVLVQWMGLQFVDEDLLRSLVATLLDVFPHVQVYRPAAAGILFVASDRPFAGSEVQAAAIAAAPDVYAELGILSPVDVAAALVLDETGARAFAGEAPLVTDNRNLLLMRSPAIARAKRPLPHL